MPRTVGKPRRATGERVTTSAGGEVVPAFVPYPLPPEPPIDLTPMLDLLSEANRALGRLDGVASVLPNTPLFLYMYVRKEALLSSQIEGTQSSLSDLLLFENDETPGVPIDDVEEVSNYVAAMNEGLRRLRSDLPLSSRLLREVHAMLLAGGRGATKAPGDFRRSQVWIGGTRPGNATFVPPPPEHVADLVSDLERFLHDDQTGLPPLVRAAMAHVQFETIHPFLDGNGRLGRLLITLMLCDRGVLREPILYLSLYLKTHRRTYYELLQRVRDEGDWEAWIEFFLTGVRDTSEQAAGTASDILALFDRDRRTVEGMGRAAGSTLRVHELLQSRPILSVPSAAKAMSLSAPTVRKAVQHLESLGIVHEASGRQRDRVYVYSAYLSILNEGTEPLR